MPVLSQIEVNETEKAIISLLKTVASEHPNKPTLRIAGGWVRDKLLGRENDDIDIAIDNMSGFEFACAVSSYMTMFMPGEDAHSIGVVRANPEQSKHLETATTFIHGLSIDFVNLRSETYADSRIPEISIGTPEQDAFRRDLTINALFYNINTGDVEDFTGRGIADLTMGFIVTPLPPLQTLTDDPLRALRAIRFASRFGFAPSPELVTAAQDSSVRDALDVKISRERIAEELRGMLRGPNPGRALELAAEFRLEKQLFPDALIIDYSYGATRVSIVQNIVTDSWRTVFLLATFLLDTTPGEAERTLKALKMSNEEIYAVQKMKDFAEQAAQLVQFCSQNTPERAELGRFVQRSYFRGTNLNWRHAVEIAKSSYSSYVWHNMCAKLVSLIEFAGLDEAYRLEPFYGGEQIAGLLQLKPGPIIGKLKTLLNDWQLNHPLGSHEEAIRYLKENVNEG